MGFSWRRLWNNPRCFFPRKFTQKSFKINKFHYETVTLQITGYPEYRGDDLIIDIS